MKLKELITEKLEISVSQFCKQAGVSRQTIDYILKGEHEPRLDTIKKICKYFKVDFHDYI